MLGHYRILKKLGAGGMGEVFLAEDARLRRKIALKVLPQNIAQDKDRLRRFEQEACAASGLNHPNILTVHEFGESEGTHFLAAEFVEGETLRERLNREGVSLIEALDIAAQTAFALSAAHAAGIVHRDIKPENIMIRGDGIVKVLDFGLAKLTEKRTENADAEAETQALVKTNPGAVMGTARYMSPEQARGKKIDQRTDIWSLGVCLYEMLAGRPPFPGETTNDTIAAILTREPPLLVHYLPDAPAELQRIVGKTLRKNCDERYQHSKDLQIDLKDLKQDLEFAAKLERSAAPDARHNSKSPVSGADVPTQIITKDKSTHNSTIALSTKNEIEANATHPTSSAEYIATGIKRHKWLTALAAFGVLALVAGAWAAYRWFGGEKTTSNIPFQNLQISVLPDSAKMQNTAISPDGKYVAYIAYDDAGKNSVAVRQLATGSTVVLVPTTEQELRSPTYSLDGTFLYYFIYTKDGDNSALYRIPAFGGSASPRKILDGVDTVISFSPDGRRFTFLRWNNKDNSRTLMTADAEAGNAQPIFTDKERGIRLATDPIWSPDGNKIIVSVNNKRGEEWEIGFIEVSVTDGSHKPFGSVKFKGFHDNFWLKDGSGIIFNGYETDTAYSQIYHLSYPAGELRRITNDVNEYDDFSISADNTMMLATRKEGTMGLTRYNPATKESVQIFPEISEGFGGSGLTVLPDGRIVHTRLKGVAGVDDLWIADADGKNARQIVTDARENIAPVVSPDGRFVVFQSNRTGTYKLWRTDLSGNSQTQLTNAEGYGDNQAQITPDGKTIIFARFKIGEPKVWLMRVPFEGGEAVMLPNQDDALNRSQPRLSPDGKRLAYFVYNRETNKSFVHIAPFDGANFGKPEREIEWIKRGGFVWSPDGKSLTFQETKDGKANLWQLPLQGDAAKPKQLTFFTTNLLGAFTWTTDGKQLLATPGTRRTDLVLIKDAAQKTGN